MNKRKIYRDYKLKECSTIQRITSATRLKELIDKPDSKVFALISKDLKNLDKDVIRKMIDTSWSHPHRRLYYVVINISKSRHLMKQYNMTTDNKIYYYKNGEVQGVTHFPESEQWDPVACLYKYLINEEKDKTKHIEVETKSV